MKEKPFLKKLLSVFSAMVIALSLMTGIPFSELDFSITTSAETITSGDCSMMNDGSVTWNYDSATTTLTIGGTGVMAWFYYRGAPWYSYAESITDVVISDGVNSIGDYAFFECTNLSSITIPSIVTYIGEGAFNNCASLPSITIPLGVTSIGDYAFTSCTSLESIIIPSSVTSIGNSVFCNCTNLTSITIPSEVTSIGNLAFVGCKSLASITIPSEVTSIGTQAFSGCTSLKSITIPSGVISISEHAFSACPNLKSVTFGKNSALTSISNNAFSGCTSLASIVIPSGVTSIGGWAFYECTSLESISIPSGVTSIGTLAFYDCTSLTTVNAPCNWDGSLYTFADTVTVNIAEHTGDAGTCTTKSTCITCGTDYYGDHTNKATEWSKDETGHWYACDCGKVDFAEHTSSGVATTTTPETCTVCGYEITPATGSDNNGSGNSGSTGGGYTPNYPSYPVNPPTTTAPSTTTPEDNNSKPADTTKPADVAKPHIKGENGKTGWNVIADDISYTDEGGKVVVDMSGATEVPKDIFNQIKGKDIDLVIELDNGFTWTINGESVDESVTTDLGVSAKADIPADVINTIAGDCDYITLTLSHNGDFGFTAVLTVDMGEENEGMFANLYYVDGEETELICSDKINSKGKADLTFTHASEYVIVIDVEAHGDNSVSDTNDDDGVSGDVSGDTSNSDADNADDENPPTGVAIGFMGIIITGAAVMLTKKKNK